MDTLPNEIVDKIIGFLDKRDLITVRLVNKIWQSCAEIYLKTNYFVVEKDKDILDFMKIISWRNSCNTIQPFTRIGVMFRRCSDDIWEELVSSFGTEIQGLRLYALGQRKEFGNVIFKTLMNTPNIEEIYFGPFRNWSLEFPKEFKLELPKLRILKFDTYEINLLRLVVNASRNLQVQLCFASPYDLDWKDLSTIFESTAARGVEFGIKCIAMREKHFCNQRINYNSINEMAQIHFNVTRLELELDGSNYTEEFYRSIEKFIQKLSKNLKYLHIKHLSDNDKRLTIDVKNMESLESLELSSRADHTKLCQLELKIGVAPSLKKLRIASVDLKFQQSVPSLKHLIIDSNAVLECRNKPLFTDETCRLEVLTIFEGWYPLTNVRKFNNNERAQWLNNYLSTQAKNLRKLTIADWTMNYNMLHFPKMVALKKLWLYLEYEKVKLQYSHFPYLEFLQLDTPLRLHSKFYSSECMENVHTLVLDSAAMPDFKNAQLQFPNLIALHLVNYKSETGFLSFVFGNMTHVKELYIDGNYKWDELTGNSEVVDFRGETSNFPSTSVPTLLDMIVMHSLKLDCRAADDENFKAIPYLISCGKLVNLKYLEVGVWKGSWKNIVPFMDIIKSNKTVVNIRYLTDYYPFQDYFYYQKIISKYSK